jgi:hypothetical protein
MATQKTDAITALAGKLVVDRSLAVACVNNVTGETSGTLYLIDIDNTLNTSTYAYVRLRDASTGDSAHASNGIPTWQFVAPPGTKISYAFPDGQPYAAGICWWCTTNPTHQNQTAPLSAVTVKLVAS